MNENNKMSLFSELILGIISSSFSDLYDSAMIDTSVILQAVYKYCQLANVDYFAKIPVLTYIYQ